MTAPRLRVLVVAADPTDASFALRVLEDNGERAEACADVPEALARLSQETFDLALVSLSMPRGDGLALVHHLRALYPDLDVVVMSAADEVEEAASAMALGVLSTVVTPLTGDEILVAADRARERRMLIAERANLHAKVASSARRTETFARCAAFVAESEPSAVAQRVLDACAAEIESTARGLFLVDPSGVDRMFRLAVDGDARLLPSQLTGRDVHVAKGQTVGEVGDEVHLLLADGDARIGLVVLKRAHSTPLSVEASELLEVIARLASATLTAARKVDAIARGGIKDPETGAYTFAYFGDVAAREIERAIRHHRAFALLTLRLSGMAELSAELPLHDLSALRRTVTAGVLSAVRDSDVVARIDDGEYYLLLPETGLLGALSCRRRILDRLASLSTDVQVSAPNVTSRLETTRPSPSIGISVFPADGGDLGVLLKLSRKRSERALRSAWHALELEGRGFWEIVEALLQSHGEDDDAVLEASGTGARASMPSQLVTRIATTLIRDAQRDRVAGTLYLAGDAELSAQVARLVTSAGHLSLRAWLLGPSSSLRDAAAEIRLPLPDSRLKQTALILCITERGGYCLVARRSEVGQLDAYHSSDLELVEGLVNALQSTYHLQPELR
jgi:CheY-like chemotaxis protein/GGDEF domain-containing protein